MRKSLTLLAVAFGGVPAALPAQGMAEPEAACPATPAPLPPELAGWAAPAPLAAATSADATAAATVTPGRAVELALKPTPQITYAKRPEQPGGSVSHGGMVALDVARAGVYRVAISTGAWLDVVLGGAALQSVNHGRGPACSGVRKMVDFRLEPGRYIVQIAANGTPSIRLLVAALPEA